MNAQVKFSNGANFRDLPSDFWKRILNDEQLRDCTNLEKILAGCEIIAALEEMDELLAA